MGFHFILFSLISERRQSGTTGVFTALLHYTEPPNTLAVAG